MVCVFTVTASISLHAGETAARRPPASETPRVGLFHQPRFSGIQARQVTGRTHRDGRTSPWRIAFAEDTVEEQVARVMVERLAVSGSAAGADTSSLQEIAELLDADWLPVGRAHRATEDQAGETAIPSGRAVNRTCSRSGVHASASRSL